MSLKDWPVREGPLEKLLAKGAHCLSDTELPAVLLGGVRAPWIRVTFW
jgi:DNA repair protein RadC